MKLTTKKIESGRYELSINGKRWGEIERMSNSAEMVWIVSCDDSDEWRAAYYTKREALCDLRDINGWN